MNPGVKSQIGIVRRDTEGCPEVVSGWHVSFRHTPGDHFSSYTTTHVQHLQLNPAPIGVVLR